MRRPVVLFVLCLLASCRHTSETVVQFFDGERALSPPLSVEVADSPAEREVGLMYRRELRPEKGMLFIFPDETLRSFWMKNTYVELDMIFLSRDYRIVAVAERTQPLAETSYPSGVPAQFVLEVTGGSAAAWGLRRGIELRKLE